MAENNSRKDFLMITVAAIILIGLLAASIVYFRRKAGEIMKETDVEIKSDDEKKLEILGRRPAGTPGSGLTDENRLEILRRRPSNSP